MTDKQPSLFELGTQSARQRLRHPEDAAALLALSEMVGVGRVSIRALYDHFACLTDVWSAPVEELTYVLHNAKNRKATFAASEIHKSRDELMEYADRLLRQFAKQRISVMFDSDADYPVRLRNANRPRWLFVQGQRALLNRQSSVAIVGTRLPTEEGLQTARRATEILTNLGFVIVSGLADGIDTEVHRVVVESGAETIAVLGNGLNVEFPAGSAGLRRKIVRSGGAIITEYLWNERYSKSTFVERNRIQAGISGAVLPIQCKVKSGTAHTIRFATELRRLLFGVALGRWKSTIENEVFEVLAQTNSPIFDIASGDGVRSMVNFLSSITTDLSPPHMGDDTRMEFIYNDAIQELRAIIFRRKPEGAEAQWLVDQFMKMLTAASEKP